MRIVVFFDLPMITSDDRRIYAKFRKFLIRSGFLMMQESVYSKLALNAVAVNAICKNVRQHTPGSGVVQMLTVTEKQYNAIEYIVGENSTEILNNTDRLVVL